MRTVTHFSICCSILFLSACVQYGTLNHQISIAKQEHNNFHKWIDLQTPYLKKRMQKASLMLTTVTVEILKHSINLRVLEARKTLKSSSERQQDRLY